MIQAIEFYNEERWFPLIAFDIIKDMYEISNFGNIRYINGNIINTHIINSGYVSIRLKTECGSKSFLVHRLVASNFILCKSVEANQVNHLDSTKINNEDINLEWCTGKENTRYAIEHGNFLLGEKNRLSKLTDDQVHQICSLLEQGKIYKEILDIMNMDSSIGSNDFDLIGNIKRGIAWNHISKNYNFSKFEYNFSDYTNDEIRYICQLLSEDKNIPEIYEILFNKKYINSRTHKEFYEFVRRIKNGITFTNISKEFNL